ncbi:hypothetical protein HHI36_004723 [Cryptolaemus montrouzieri]|uniref:PiggyBac transposable element-derived protein domain-containing protein n=1 Tax=Cryptolaemus montrouzieri TaxID=559131 RepID=A0ABD2NT00_9CUCU
MARKFLTDDELRKIIEEIDSDNEYEFSDENDWESEDNVEEQIEIPDEIDVENDSENEIPANSGTNTSKSGFQWQSHPIPSTRLVHNSLNTSVGIKNARCLRFDDPETSQYRKEISNDLKLSVLLMTNL